MSVWLWFVTYSVSMPAIKLLSSRQPPDPAPHKPGDAFLRLGEQSPGLATGDRAFDRLAGDIADLEPPFHSRPFVAREFARAENDIGDLCREALAVIRGADDRHPRDLGVAPFQRVGPNLLRRGGELDELPSRVDVPRRRRDREHRAVETGVPRPPRSVRDGRDANRVRVRPAAVMHKCQL